jgi:cytidylate kinase
MGRKRTFCIAIDGEAAAGKSTIGSLLAQRLGYLYFDTGVMYRAVTLGALQHGLDVHDEASVTALAESLPIRVASPTHSDGRQYTVYANGADVTWAIREPAVEAAVSIVAAYPGVRHALTLQQRQIAAMHNLVMVGRDIGTVVMPDADLKVYMRASVEERARRRYKEMLDRGEHASYEEVLRSMQQRDDLDSHRTTAPLRAADDAVIIATDGMSVEKVLERVLALVEQILGAECGDS